MCLAKLKMSVGVQKGKKKKKIYLKKIMQANLRLMIGGGVLCSGHLEKWKKKKDNKHRRDSAGFFQVITKF